jgi:hypothetical protein
MGILNNKTRIFDTIVTQEGRRQLATGKMRIEFVSFTDRETFYEADSVSGSSDPSTRLFLEASDLPQDRITFEADDSGKLMPFKGSNLGVLDGKVLTGSSDQFLTIVTGSTFTSVAETLLGSSIDNFRQLYAIRNDDAFLDEEREFTVNTNNLEFKITDRSPLGRKEIKKISIEHIESLFQDKRLSHLPNFRYLPPVNKATTLGGTTTPLGNFPVIGQRRTPMSYADLKVELESKDYRIIEFNATSIQCNVMCQIFELKQDRLLKLDVIDFGDVMTDDPEFPEKRIFFVGKVFIDSLGVQTFVNMFTMVFE